PTQVQRPPPVAAADPSHRLAGAPAATATTDHRGPYRLSALHGRGPRGVPQGFGDLHSEHGGPSERAILAGGPGRPRGDHGELCAGGTVVGRGAGSHHANGDTGSPGCATSFRS